MTQPLRILVADDDAEMVHYYARTIPHLGHMLLGAAGNGRDLVDACRQLQPGLVISDIRMPEIDGVSAMESVQCDSCIPFIFISGDEKAEFLPRLKRGYVLQYLRKPVRTSELRSALEAASDYFRIARSVSPTTV